MVTKADETFNIPIWNKVMLTKEEAAAYSHIGINKLEELLKIPNCPFVLYVGKKKLIKRAEFERYLLENIEIYEFTFELMHAIIIVGCLGSFLIRREQQHGKRPSW